MICISEQRDETLVEFLRAHTTDSADITTCVNLALFLKSKSSTQANILSSLERYLQVLNQSSCSLLVKRYRFNHPL